MFPGGILLTIILCIIYFIYNISFTWRYEVEEQSLEETSKTYNNLQEEISIPDMDDDMNLIQKRYHVAGDTPCHLKVGNGKCGYFYKSFDDLNQHIKNFHKPQCDLSKSEEEQIFAVVLDI